MSEAGWGSKRIEPPFLNIRRVPPFTRDAHLAGEDFPRKLRADAERNRQALLEVARLVFAAEGTDASLEEIARRAGVGIGTLYRHFPTRAELVGEVYRQEVMRLGENARMLAESRPPVEALREWLLLFVDYLATKKILADALRTLAGGDMAASTTGVLEAAITLLADRGVAAKELSLSLPPLDLLRAITGVANASAGPGWEAGARAMVDLLIAGMRR